MLNEIEKDVFLGNPFIYRLRPDIYPLIIKTILNKPHFFDEITRLKNDISNNQLISEFPPGLQEYFSLIKKEVDKNSKPGELLNTLGAVEEYKIFFKEMGSSLKFNPLSRNKSAIQIRERANSLIDKFGYLIQPRAVARYINVIIHDDNLIVEESGIEFKSKKLSSFFSDAGKKSDKENKTNEIQKMIIYVVSIGPGIDDTVKTLGREGEMFDSYVLNAIGAAAAEMIAEDLNFYFNDTLVNGNTGLQYYRFSPGYGDWFVNDQVKIFKLLKPEERIGVILNEGCIMLPEKSTSGIMGLKTDTNKQIFHSGSE